MKNSGFFIIIFAFNLLTSSLNSQTRKVDGSGRPVYNYETFTDAPTINISGELLGLTSPSAYNHPEFGVNPYNITCTDCIELIDQRTENSRYYVKKGTGGSYFYRQTSSIDLHYKNAKGELITIDARLKQTDVTGVYTSKDQITSTKLNLLDGYSELELMNNSFFKFNKDLRLFSSNITENITSNAYLKCNYTQNTVGEDGCRLWNSWSGINTEMQYAESSVKTNFILNDLSSIQTNDAYTIIEDVLELPKYMRIKYDNFEGTYNENGIWEGDLLLVDINDMEYARFTRPVIYDADTAGIREEHSFITGYKIVEELGIYKIQLFVNNDYLKHENRVFPITIDPLVFVVTNWVGISGSNFSPSYCPLVVNATTPANVTLTNATVYWEIDPSNLGDCGALATSRCHRDKARVYISTSCFTSAVYSCSPCPDYFNWNPTIVMTSLVTCLTPQCAAYTIPFTLNLARTACSGGSCLTNCIPVVRFDVTIEGYTIQAIPLLGAIGMDTYTILDCITQTATFTASVQYGVPPYTYSWSPSGGTGATDTDVYPLGVTVVTLTVTDACGNIITDNVTVTNPCLLPITLTSFNGYHADGKNYLHWTTESEKNSEVFFIERSFDGLSFETIGSLPAAGNSNTIIEYNFVDTKPGASINYYRLREKDLDGTISYSGIIAIRSEEINVNSIELNSANPTSGELNISVVSTMEGNGNFEIIDISGRIIYNKNLFLNNGINSVMLYPGQIAAGTYILKFTKNDQFETIKFEMF